MHDKTRGHSSEAFTIILQDRTTTFKRTGPDQLPGCRNSDDASVLTACFQHLLDLIQITLEGWRSSNKLPLKIGSLWQRQVNDWAEDAGCSLFSRTDYWMYKGQSPVLSFSWSELQSGTNYTFINLISFFTLTHSCFHLNTYFSSVLSKNVHKITSLMLLIIY